MEVLKPLPTTGPPYPHLKTVYVEWMLLQMVYA